MRAEQFIDEWAAQGRNAFTTEEAVEAIGASPEAVRAQLRRLKQRGRIADPMRSFHVLVPPEYRRMGCPPAEHFIDQLMETLREPYYVALLSAAERHGAAHQRPQGFQVMVPRNRPALACGQVRVTFIARADLARLPVARFNGPHGFLRYSTPEVTALELVGYPQYGGGMGNVATVLAELAEVFDEAQLVTAAKACPVGWAQRLGYLLERTHAYPRVSTLAAYVAETANSYIPLRRAEGVGGATRDARWKVIVNTEVEPDE